MSTPVALAAATRDLSVVLSFVEESADHRLFIAAALLEDGQIRHVHRKLFLPTYGLFDERRFFGHGDMLRAVPSRMGVASTRGCYICGRGVEKRRRAAGSACNMGGQAKNLHGVLLDSRALATRASENPFLHSIRLISV